MKKSFYVLFALMLSVMILLTSCGKKPVEVPVEPIASQSDIATDTDIATPSDIATDSDISTNTDLD